MVEFIVDVVNISNGIKIGISSSVNSILFFCNLMVSFIVMVLIKESNGVFNIKVKIRVIYILIVKFKNMVSSGDNSNNGIKLIS